MPLNDRKKIFEKFYRGADAQKLAMGSGLGLFIAKTGIEANGGEAWFESDKKRGTTFYFTVPKRNPTK